MFVLRTIAFVDGLTENKSIGEKYTLVRKDDPLFKEMHDLFWNVKNLTAGETMFSNTCAILTSEDGERVPLFDYNLNYIMSGNGQTFEKI